MHKKPIDSVRVKCPRRRCKYDYKQRYYEAHCRHFSPTTPSPLVGLDDEHYYFYEEIFDGGKTNVQ